MSTPDAEIGDRSFGSLVRDYAPPRLWSLGRSIFDPIWAEQEHPSHGTEIMHVLRGRVRVETATYSIVGREGDTIYTPADVLHRDVFAPGTTFEVYLAHFDWAGEASLLRRATPPRLTDIAPTIKTQLASDFQVLFRDFQRPGPFRHELTGLRLLQIILTMYREALDHDRQPDPPVSKARRVQIMNQTKQFIAAQYATALSLDRIAQNLGISPYYLSRVFSAQSGFTLSSYLTTVRMEKAAELLSGGRRGVAEVALRIGYRDPHYFSRVFRAHYGQSPSTYRAGTPSGSR